MKILVTIFCLMAANFVFATGYVTSFPLTESPISEGGVWTNGFTTGLDWSDVHTTTGFAFGTQSGSGGVNDTTAVVAGDYGSGDQVAQAVVHIATRDNIDYEEVELRLKTKITGHSITGYEILFSVNADDPYVQIARWNGPFANYDELNNGVDPPIIQDGDVVKAVYHAGTITAYVNGVQACIAGDSTYTTGQPGIGSYLQTGTHPDHYGFSSFVASDGSDPFIVTQPSSQSVTVGANATFTVAAGGFSTLSYQWKFNGSNVGSNSSNYTRSNCQLSDDGGTVTCVVTDTAGNVTTSSVTLSVTGGTPAAFFPMTFRR